MFDQLWKNLTIFTASDSAPSIIENGAIGITGNIITYVGETADLPATIIHDGTGRSVTPGLIDCHTHLIYAGNRADEFDMRLQGRTYAEIAAAGGGIVATVRATRDISEEDLYILSQRRLAYLRLHGVTGVEIKSGYGLDLETERKILRVATRLRDEENIPVQRSFLGAHAVPPEFKNNTDGYIDHICNTILPTLAHEGLVDAVDGFCETIAFSPAQIARVFDCAHRLNLPVKLHAEQLSNQHSTKLAATYKALSADHLEYLDDDGITAMKESGTVAVLLPVAFYYLREKQLPPVEKLRRAGIPIALATDHNPGTSPVLCPLTVMNMGAVLFGLTVDECLRGMTSHAARALGWQDTRGKIEVGMRADLAFWNVRHPRELVYRLGVNPLSATLENGEYYIVE